MPNLKKWSSILLIRHLRELHDLIYGYECFSTHDLVIYGAIWRELDRRGFITNEVVDLDVSDPVPSQLGYASL